jgi:hypothetical protein
MPSGTADVGFNGRDEMDLIFNSHLLCVGLLFLFFAVVVSVFLVSKSHLRPTRLTPSSYYRATYQSSFMVL